MSKILEDDCEAPDFVESFLDKRHNHGDASAKPPWTLRTKSYMPIPFRLPRKLKQVMFESPECQIQTNDEGSILIPFLPESSSKFAACTTCKSPWRSDSPVLCEWLSETSNLILRRYSLKCLGKYYFLVLLYILHLLSVMQRNFLWLNL